MSKSTSTATRPVGMTVKSKRKPFGAGTRVERVEDGERGTVEEAVTSDDNSAWIVIVKMDNTGSGTSGLQYTAARGAWRKVAADDADATFSEVDAQEQSAQLAAEKHELSDDDKTAEYAPSHGGGEARGGGRADGGLGPGAVDAPRWNPESASESVQREWDAQEEQESANAQKRAQRFVCTFSECIHHNSK